MSKLDIKSIILNEREVAAKMIAEKVIPSYIKDKDIVNSITRYYMCKDDFVINRIKEVLDANGLYSSKDRIKSLVEGCQLTELRDIKEPVVIYKEEVETINKLKSRVAKRVLFAMLVLLKINNIKYEKKDNRTYYFPQDYYKYADVNFKENIKAYNTLQQEGYINIPLFDDVRNEGDIDGMILEFKIIKFEGDVAYTIEDHFESSKDHFINVFGLEGSNQQSKLLAIHSNDFSYFTCEGYTDAVNILHELGIKSSKANIQKASRWERNKEKGYWFVNMGQECWSDDKIELQVARFKDLKSEISRLKKMGKLNELLLA